MQKAVSAAILAIALVASSVNAQPIEKLSNTTMISTSNSSLVVNLGYVQYRGIQKEPVGPPREGGNGPPVKSWYGIRYAASPEGVRRWAAPVDIESASNYSSSQVIDATQIGPACLNGKPGWSNSSASAPGSLPGLPTPHYTSEDCLLLNIHAPKSSTNLSRLPVMVQIHGGGYIAGSAESSNGEYLVSRSNGSIIYVEIQYRLGGLGFLSGSAIRAGGIANAGYADQRSALEWIQRHITAFGGDPGKVTISGGSSGGGSVAAQMQLYGGTDKTPFRAAIAEYPAVLQHHDDVFLDNQYQLLLNAAKCNDLACLRSLSFDQISAAINCTYATGFQEGLYGAGDFFYQPTVDGHLIRELPSVAFRNGHFAKVPLLTDHNGFEGISFVHGSIDSDSDIRLFLHKLYPTATDAFLDQVNQLYPAGDFGEGFFQQPMLQDLNHTSPRGMLLRTIVPGLASNYDRKNAYYFKLAQIFGDVAIVCPAQWLASGVANQSVPSWKLNYNSGIYIHGAVDVANLDPIRGISDKGETNALQAYHVGFVVDLDPNKGPVALQRQSWLQYGIEGNVLEINQTAKYVSSIDPDINARCQFWLDNAPTVRF